MLFGRFLAGLRKAAKLTQQQLADLLELDRVSVSNWERNKNLPDAKKMPEIARHLKVSVGDLMREAYPLAGTAYRTEEIEHAPAIEQDPCAELLAKLPPKIAAKMRLQIRYEYDLWQLDQETEQHEHTRQDDPPQQIPKRQHSN